MIISDNHQKNQSQVYFRKYTKRNISLIISLLSIVSVSISPVRADVLSLLQTSGLFGQLTQQLQTIFPQMTSVLQWVSKVQNALNDPCNTSSNILTTTPPVEGSCTAIGGNNGTSIISILSQNTGVMGIPDPNQAKAKIEQDVNSSPHSPDVFNNNKTSYTLDLQHISDRTIADINNQTVLSEDGQQQTKKNIDQITQTTQDIGSVADAAQGRTNSQDVLKDIAHLIGQQAVLASLGQASNINSRTDAAITNTNLSNISQTLDDQKRAQQAQELALAMYPLIVFPEVNLY